MIVKTKFTTARDANKLLVLRNTESVDDRNPSIEFSFHAESSPSSLQAFRVREGEEVIGFKICLIDNPPLILHVVSILHDI